MDSSLLVVIQITVCLSLRRVTSLTKKKKLFAGGSWVNTKHISVALLVFALANKSMRTDKLSTDYSQPEKTEDVSSTIQLSTINPASMVSLLLSTSSMSSLKQLQLHASGIQTALT